MELLHPVCCGMDVHKEIVVACLRKSKEGGEVVKHTLSFGTTVKELGELAAWLTEENCPIAAMESTGVYWKPVYHILSQTLEVVVGNARDMKQVPGKKTDKRDASWISELLAHGLINPSFIPTPELSALRGMTRTRVTYVQTRSQAKNRVHKVLQEANIKLSSFASDVFGKSGRAMLDALVCGERNPEVLADLAKGRLRAKISSLELALEGCFTENHALLIRQGLEQIDYLDRQIAELDSKIEELIQPMATEVEQVVTIPGVDRKAASIIISEIGIDLVRFGSAKRLASWAGLCPGNNESAGKRRSGKTRKGNRALRRLLPQCAWAARKTDSYLGRTFLRLEHRLGSKKAAIAIGHKILVIIYHLLTEGTLYDEECYDRPDPRQEERIKRNAIRRLEDLGYEVVVKKAA